MAQKTQVDRQGLEVLSDEECRRYLEQAPLGRVGFEHSGKLLVLPVNYRVHDGALVFRTAEGSKLDAVNKHPGLPVGFEVDDYKADERTGWSVVVQGTMQKVVDRGLVAELEELGLRSWAEVAERDQWLRIVPERITGRRILPLADEAGK